MTIKHYRIIIVLFVETPRKFITAKLSIRKPGSSSVLIIYWWRSGLTDRKLCSNKFTWCFHKQNYYMFYHHANIQRTYYRISCTVVVFHIRLRMLHTRPQYHGHRKLVISWAQALMLGHREAASRAYLIVRKLKKAWNWLLWENTRSVFVLHTLWAL
jgi:hypothetical protein